jgi:diguanylate cyclase (GGDEF)-like protein
LGNLLEKFKYIIIIVLALIMIIILSAQYTSLKEVVREKYASRRQLVEKNILQTVDHINDAYIIAEQQLNQEMKNYSQVMKDKYQQNPEIMEWDLEELKNDFGGYDIYIIDSSLKIIRTTYQEDLGFDFSKFGSFSQALKRRMAGESFEVDRIDLATQTGEIKKYSYLPAPDNKYLFELSIAVQDKFPTFKSLDIFRDATRLTEEYDIVEEISFYSVEPIDHKVAKLRSSVRPYLDPNFDEFEKNLAAQAVKSNNLQTKTINEEKNNLIYRFFPVLESDKEGEQGWNSYVIGIIYNDQVMLQEIKKHQNLFLITILLMIIFLISFIAVVVYLLDKFEHQANHDKLTGLANRKLFIKEFSKLKQEADKTGHKLALIFLDIDNFKQINDNFGHDAGDKVLERIASRMKNNLKSKDLLARLGGDEFVITLVEVESEKNIKKIAKRLIDNLKGTMMLNEDEIFISVSGGISIYPDSADNLDELIKISDAAMYRAKKSADDVIL